MRANKSGASGNEVVISHSAENFLSMPFEGNCFPRTGFLTMLQLFRLTTAEDEAKGLVRII
jgi:hypothetical protein